MLGGRSGGGDEYDQSAYMDMDVEPEDGMYGEGWKEAGLEHGFFMMGEHAQPKIVHTDFFNNFEDDFDDSDLK